MATVMTLASRTRLRTGTSTSEVVMVLWRYSLVTQSTPIDRRQDLNPEVAGAEELAPLAAARRRSRRCGP